MRNERRNKELDEVEIRVLLPTLPPEISLRILNRQYDFEEIEQVYLVGSGDRIRKLIDKDGNISYSRTIKVDVPNTQGIVRREEIEEISPEEYENLFTQREGKVIQKTRYYVPLNSLVLEVNMFHGDLEGRLLGEIEFGNYEQALAFNKPEWMGRIVTEEISNRTLAMGGIIPRL